jgi:tetraacyldisaccharide 4'-kinase
MFGHILRAWKNKNAFFYLILIPLSWFFSAMITVRRKAYQTGLLHAYTLTVPVIVVGNINMGGSGKTPIVIWLVEQLRNNGYNPGVISRGYGVNRTKPMQVLSDSLASQVGDEPLLIARRVACPVWVGKHRTDVGRALLNGYPACDVIISDDGLQHYQLRRNLDIVVVDAETTNAQYLLPAGPLREPQCRLDNVDAIVCHGDKVSKNIKDKFSEHAFEMQLHGQIFYNLLNVEQTVTADYFKGKLVKAIAGIGKPERFFNQLTELGLNVEGISFDDHHVFSAQDLAEISAEAIIMTEKDAVKCQSFAQAHHWVLPVEAKIETGLLTLVLAKLKTLQ